MPEYLAPGVYVEEVAAGPVPIEGVSTTTTGFVGQTVRGPLAARLVTGWMEYSCWFGCYTKPDDSYLPFAVKGFFDNGGQRAFIARVIGTDPQLATLPLATQDTAGAAGPNLEVQAISPGTWGNRLFVRVLDSTQRDRQGNPVGFRLTVLYYDVDPPLPGGFLVNPLDPANIREPDRREPTAVEDFDNLRSDPAAGNYAAAVVNGGSRLVRLEWPGNSTTFQPPPSPANPPPAINPPPGFQPLTGGGDGAAVTVNDYLGNDDPVPPAPRTGLAALAAIDEVALLCVPDQARRPPAPDGAQIAEAMVNQCLLLKDRFAVLSIPEDPANADVSSIQKPKDTSYAAVYFPRIRIPDPQTPGATVLMPPAGHVTGIYARTDSERGIHKAPANEVVRGILTTDVTPAEMPLEFKVTKGQQDILNPRGINVIRDFRADGRGIRVWGARTLSSDPQWKYVNMRRLFIFIKESIDQGTHWVVFEPNDDTTWQRVSRSVANFLATVWRSGALMGTTVEEAFFVKCDRTTMNQDDIDNGRLIVLVGIAPVNPAEFVIFRISQKTAEAPSSCC
jgi:Bacteriophage tail sheath protein